jgi:hypothetical protein
MAEGVREQIARIIEDPLASSLAKADQIITLCAGEMKSSPRLSLLGGEADGGWSFVQQLFAPREVVRLAVPGIQNDEQLILVGFADGGSIEAKGPTTDAAWQELRKAAKTLQGLGK